MRTFNRGSFTWSTTIRSTKVRVSAAALAAALGTVIVPATSALGSSTPKSTQDNGPVTPVADATCENFTATTSVSQQRVVTNVNPGNYTSTAWTNLDCGSATVTVPRGHRGLVVAKVDGEVSCQGPLGQWCLGRVLINGVPGRPNASETDGSFAWTHAQNDLSQYESNAFTRTWWVSCPLDAPASTCNFPVVTQVMNHTSDMWFRVDDTTVDIHTTYQ